MKQKLCKVGDLVKTPPVCGPKKNQSAMGEVKSLSIDGSNAMVFVNQGALGWSRWFPRAELKVIKRKAEMKA